MTPVCKIDDDYVRDRVRWVVKLSNGETIYEDDDRPGLEERSAWKRLKFYCEETNTFIVEMWLQFRSNRILIEPKEASGYFFVKSASGIWGHPRTYHAYIVGTVKEGVIHAKKWRVPELVLLGVETRQMDAESPCLIMRRG